jgi:hypothetical protein
MTTTELVAIIVKETSDGNEILNDDVAEVGKGKDEGCVDKDHFHTVKRTVRANPVRSIVTIRSPREKPADTHRIMRTL